MEDLILRMEWANVMNLERLRTMSDGNRRLYEAWKALKQFNQFRYDKRVRAQR